MKRLLAIFCLMFSFSALAQQNPVQWYRPAVDEDEACKTTCGEQVGQLTYDVPTYEQMWIIQELVRSYVRQQVYNKRIPVYWNPEVAGDIQWQSPPSVDWRAWRPQIKFCSKQMYVMATLPGGGTGMFCATGISFKDRIVISLVDPKNVASLVAWETTNNWLFWRFGLQTQPWPDGPMVGEVTNWVNTVLKNNTSGGTFTKPNTQIEGPGRTVVPKKLNGD